MKGDAITMILEKYKSCASIMQSSGIIKKSFLSISTL